MKMITRLAFLIALTLAFAGQVNAATLSLIGGTSGVTLPSNFSGASHLSLTGLTAGVDQVTTFDSSNPNQGLALSASSKIRFDYLGKEAGYTNQAIELAGFGILFNTNTSAPGSSVTVQLAPNIFGLLPFKFTTSGGGGQEAENGSIDNPLAIAFSAISVDGKSVIALFGDGAGDHDYDDMAIRISVVPLPPALLLFGGALLGLAWLGRKRPIE